MLQGHSEQQRPAQAIWRPLASPLRESKTRRAASCFLKRDDDSWSCESSNLRAMLASERNISKYVDWTSRKRALIWKYRPENSLFDDKFENWRSQSSMTENFQIAKTWFSLLKSISPPGWLLKIGSAPDCSNPWIPGEKIAWAWRKHLRLCN